ncbi:MAG: hypothetical protein MUF20_10230 [Methylotetracoccus sp.]|nr:hypothetical protein [Methylotetracoccus sp.]
MQMLLRNDLTPAPGLAELEGYFSGIRPPYTLNDIWNFNRLYRRLYPVLNRDEKIRAEQWVDRLIDNVERKEWASKIYGVV